ncbi:MAG: acetylornithine/succinylornithine family transaminase [Thermoleophilaceae bacterium]|nr:acetylornithine/succinylornithine family transaminase [Thermoleophilaceae bacterium]
MALSEIYGEASAQTGNYARYGVEFVRGSGVHLYDAEGNEYLDFLCGLGVTSLGHCHPAIVEAIERQSRELIHTSNLFWTPPAEQLARALTDRSFASNAFFCNSGAEANEAAIKLARAYAHGNGSNAREIVVLERAFHGRTMGALSATPQEDKQAPFTPLVHGFKTVPNDDAAAMTAAVTPHTCAVLIEPVQGEGGVFAIPDDVLIAAREACDAVGALLIFDEVQCGLGRSGSLFAYEQTPVVPDVMTLAKALGGGLPIGAMLAAEHCAGALQPGYHGSTFGGNPVACAAACVAFDLLADAELQSEANELGKYLAERLSAHGSVQGRGLMLGVELDQEIDAKQVVSDLLNEHRVIANATGPSTLRFLPPLIATTEDADVALTALAQAIPS